MVYYKIIHCMFLDILVLNNLFGSAFIMIGYSVSELSTLSFCVSGKGCLINVLARILTNLIVQLNLQFLFKFLYVVDLFPQFN